MRISRIKLKNYRQYRKTTISFSKNTDQDVHVLMGIMGTGKTNVMNAVSFCLYGDEPNLSKDSQLLPRVNLKHIEETPAGQKADVVVDLRVEGPDKKPITFTRTENYVLYGSGKHPVSYGSHLEIKKTDGKGNTEILEKDEADAFVERFVPKGIREYFFFNGERLDAYFKEATGQHIKNAVFRISQTDLLEKVETHLSSLLRDFRKRAGKENPQIDFTRSALEDSENRLKEVEARVDELTDQTKIARQKLKEYEDNLRGIPDISGLQDKKKRLQEKKKEHKELLEAKQRNKEELLVEDGTVLLLHSALHRLQSLVEGKRKKKELPPTIDEKLLNDILEEGECICGRPVTSGSDEERNITDLLEVITISPELAQELIEMEASLGSLTRRLKKFRRTIDDLSREVLLHEGEIGEIETQIGRINADIGGFDVEKVKEWQELSVKFEYILSDALQDVGIKTAERKKVRGEIRDLKEQLKKDLKREAKVETLTKSIEFIEKALGVVGEAKGEVMDRIRKSIQKKTQGLFFDLIWKKDTFKRVVIGDDYSLHLTHKLGYEALGSISGGEREVLALALTLALHEVSGFDSPMMVDRPLAMVSGDPIKNIIETFLTVGRDRQVFLFLTPDDYSEKIAGLLDQGCSSRHRIDLSSDEKVARIEAL